MRFAVDNFANVEHSLLSHDMERRYLVCILKVVETGLDPISAERLATLPAMVHQTH
jgi:hypothetical protein